jgi:hypothetical protein
VPGGGAGPRFLDGHTADASVHPAPHTNAPFSGTRWLRTDLSDGNFTLRCMGTGPGDRRFLDGNTGQATVAMAPNAEFPFTGTHWKLEIPFGDDNVAVPAADRGWALAVRHVARSTRTDDEILDGTNLYRNSLTGLVAQQNRPHGKRGGLLFYGYLTSFSCQQP